MPHRVFFPGLVHALHPEADGPREITIHGPEALHAFRVKRVTSGEPLTLFDGKGHSLACSVALISKDRSGAWFLSVRALAGLRVEPRVVPAVHVYAPAPKGAALEQMIDSLVQVGAASWTCLRTARSVVDPRDAKLDRLARIAEEALKQSGGAWAMELRGKSDFSEALSRGTSGCTVLADASGDHRESARIPPEVMEVSLFIGPEGGFTLEELDLARRLGVRVLRFGPLVMRIETAAVVACAACIQHTAGG